MAKAAPDHDKSEVSSLIEVYFSDLTVDFGMASIPKLLGRFWIYLASQGQHLNDRQFALLMQVLMLRDAQDFELRVSNLPMMSSPVTLERDKTELRRMGLVFTERLYYPLTPGSNPVMRAQRWDLRSLFYNLEQVARLWLDRQQILVTGWEVEGKQGHRPVYTFPSDFTHEVRLPREVALDIVNGKLFPVPDLWQQAAEAVLAQPEPPKAERTRPETSGAGAVSDDRTRPITRGAEGRTRCNTRAAGSRTRPITRAAYSRTRPKTRGHLLEDEEERGGGIDNSDLFSEIFAYFADCKADPGYQPSEKDRKALQEMLDQGYTVEEILDWIDLAFERANKPRHFTFVAILAHQSSEESHTRLPESRSQSEAVQPETRTQPETRPEAESTPGQAGEIEGSDVSKAAAIYQSTNRELTPDVLARLRLMATRCDSAARRENSTGEAWLADALEASLGIAQPDKLLNYASAVLSDWMTNGKPAVKAKMPETPEDLAPELVLFQQATGGRLPLPDQRQIVIDAIREHRYQVDNLRPYWEAWVSRDRKRTDLDWLLDWAAKGVIPPAFGSAKPSTPQFKSLPALQAVAEKYGGLNHE